MTIKEATYILNKLTEDQIKAIKKVDKIINDFMDKGEEDNAWAVAEKFYETYEMAALGLQAYWELKYDC